MHLDLRKVKGSGMEGLFKIKDHHKELMGKEDPVLWKTLVNEIKKYKHPDRHFMACQIDPFHIMNVSYLDLPADAFRYPGGVDGDKFRELMDSIESVGVANTVIGYSLHREHKFWRKRRYVSERYSVKEGVHRVCACQVLNVKVPMIVVRRVE